MAKIVKLGRYNHQCSHCNSIIEYTYEDTEDENVDCPVCNQSTTWGAVVQEGTYQK